MVQQVGHRELVLAGKGGHLEFMGGRWLRRSGGAEETTQTRGGLSLQGGDGDIRPVHGQMGGPWRSLVTASRLIRVFQKTKSSRGGGVDNVSLSVPCSTM